MVPRPNKNVVPVFCEKEPPTLKQIIGAGSNFFICMLVSDTLLGAEKIGDSQIKSDMKLGPQTHSVLSPSLNRPYNWSQKHGKWR